MSNKIRLVGGYRGYREAVYDAYHIACHNPCIRYSEREGFTASSDMRGCNPDEYMVGRAAYDANSGQPYQSGSAGEYLEVRREIIAWIRRRRRAEQMAETIDNPS